MKPNRQGPGRRLLKNGLSGILASGLGGAIQFVTLLMIIRFLPVEEFGRFSGLLSFGLVVQYIADFGLSSILVKEFAARPAEEQRLRGKAQGLVWCVTFALFLGSALVIFFLYDTWVTRSQALLMAVMGVAFFQCAGYTAIVRAREEMEWNAYGHIFHKVVLIGGVALAIALQGGIWGIVSAHAASGLLLLGFYAAVVARRYGLAPASWDPPYWATLFKRSIPLGSGLFVRQFSWQIDILILTALTSDYIVGLFSAPYRIFAACLLIAQVLSIPIFPMLSRLAAAGDMEGFGRIYRRSLKFLLLLGVPVAVLGWAFADLVVTRVLGSAYAETVQVFRLLSLAFPLIFAGSLFPFVFAALDRQLTFVALSVVGLALRAGTAFLLIPVIGFMGACYGVLLAETLVLALWIIALHRKGLHADVPRLLVGVGGGLAVTIGLLLLANPGSSIVHTALAVGAAGLVFIVLLLCGRVLDPAERDALRNLRTRLRRRGAASPAELEA
jgi:O-antigen/teichoic acid export membrane protein